MPRARGAEPIGPVIDTTHIPAGYALRRRFGPMTRSLERTDLLAVEYGQPDAYPRYVSLVTGTLQRGSNKRHGPERWTNRDRFTLRQSPDFRSRRNGVSVDDIYTRIEKAEARLESMCAERRAIKSYEDDPAWKRLMELNHSIIALGWHIDTLYAALAAGVK